MKIKKLFALMLGLCLFFICGFSAWASGTVNWGLSYRNGPGQPPSGPVTKETLSEYGAYYMGDSDQKILYLTFDCGYENGNAEKILDVLKKHHAPAAFFIVGHYLKTAPEIVKRMTDEGHLVCNHSVNHPDFSKISSEKMYKEISDLSSSYYALTGRQMAPFFRPPEGAFDQEALETIQSMGYHTTLWSVAYKDWDPASQPAPDSALSTLRSRVHNGAIILLHVVSETNANILDRLLSEWENQGYTFEALSSLPGMQQPTVTARPNEQPFLADGIPVFPTAYMIQENNYVKLRDVAAILKGTDAQFSVSYEEETKTVSLSTGEPYEIAGGELSGPENVAAMQTRPSQCPLLLDGKEIRLQSYMMNGSNYIKLRDLAAYLDFQVSWEKETNTVLICSASREQETLS